MTKTDWHRRDVLKAAGGLAAAGPLAQGAWAQGAPAEIKIGLIVPLSGLYARPGAVIIVDNVVREGAVADGASTDAAVKGVRRLNELMASDSRVNATVLQTVGVKGYDGFAIAIVNSIS